METRPPGSTGPILIEELDYTMVGSTHRQVALFHSPLDQQISELKDDLLEPMDGFLDDSQLVDLVRTRLAGRRPASGRTGRRGLAPDRLLRCCVLKHTKGLSFRELEQQLRVNLLYRRFTRFEADVTPDHTTLSRNFALLGDSSLLGDGVRVLTGVLKRVADHCEEGTLAVVDHSRAVTRRLLEISRAARSFTQASKERLTQGYQRLVGMTVKVANQAERVLDGLRSGKLRVHSGPVAATAHAA